MDVLKEIQKDFTTHEYSLVVLYEKFSGFCKQEMPHSERLAALIKAAVELTTQEAPDWEFIAARLLNFQLSKKLEKQAASAGIRLFLQKTSTQVGRHPFVLRQTALSDGRRTIR